MTHSFEQKKSSRKHHVLLLRGLAREKRHWEEFPAALEGLGLFPHMIDLPGAGTEFQRVSPRSIQSIADDVRDRWLILKRGLEMKDMNNPTNKEDRDWTLVGLSLGGMVAMSWCERYTQDFSRLVLMNSSAKDVGAVYERFQLEAAQKIGRLLLAKDLQKRETEILQLTSNLRTDVSELAEKWAGYMETHPMSKVTLLSQLYAASQFRTPRSLDLPTLVVTSEADRLVDPKCSRRIAELLNAELRIHQKAGHDLTLDDPIWVASQVNDWIQLSASSKKPDGALIRPRMGEQAI